jgi:hypothetical protein
VVSGEEEPPAWPVLEEGVTYELVSERAMASLDGVNFYVKPDGMSFREFLDLLPKRPG